MPTFKRQVTEIRAYACLYTIEAESEEEANRKALKGETVEEATLSILGIVERSLDEMDPDMLPPGDDPNAVDLMVCHKPRDEKADPDGIPTVCGICACQLVCMPDSVALMETMTTICFNCAERGPEWLTDELNRIRNERN